MLELTLREDYGGRYTVAVRCSRRWRTPDRRRVEEVLAGHRHGYPRWDRAGVVISGLWEHPARRLLRALAATLGLEVP